MMLSSGVQVSFLAQGPIKLQGSLKTDAQLSSGPADGLWPCGHVLPCQLTT